MPTSMPLVGNILAITLVTTSTRVLVLLPLKDQVALINNQISTVPASTSILSLVYAVRSGGKFSHLFEMYSRDYDHLFANCPTRHVSDWRFQKLLEKCEGRQADFTREHFNLIRNEPPINEIIWKRQCHMFFRSLRSPRSFILYSLDDPSKSITWHYPGGTICQIFKFGSFLTRLQALIKGRTSGYFEPVSTTFPTLDSSVYQPGRLDVLKMAVGMERDGGITGFKLIQRWLNLEGPASHVRPSKIRPWRFIFVVPEETAASFKLQSFGNDWNSKVKQYVLGLSQQDVLEY